jgi:hypothetical protein
MGRIGHIVKFPSRDSYFPDTDLSGAWGGSNEIETSDGYVLSSVVNQPPHYEPQSGFLYVMTDHMGRILVGMQICSHHYLIILVFGQEKEQDLLQKTLARTFKSPLGRAQGIVAYSIFIAKQDLESDCIFYVTNPHHSVIHAESYKVAIKYKVEEHSPLDAFKLWFEAFRLQNQENELFYGRISLFIGLKILVEVGIYSTSIVMLKFQEYLSQYGEVDVQKEMHPNGTGCTEGSTVHHCGECGKFCES